MRKGVFFLRKHEIVNKLFRILGWFNWPYFFVEALLQNRFVRGKDVLLSLDLDSEIIEQAKRHLDAVRKAFSEEASERWETYLKKIRNNINQFKTTKEVISFAQGCVDFDHRQPVFRELHRYPLYEKALKKEFPLFTGIIDKMQESPYSLPETLCMHKKRLVSNIFFFHLRQILKCLSHIKKVETICEIGPGYGGAIRLWLQNPVCVPKRCVLIDFPECLFFAEVFLRVNFPNFNFVYIADSKPIDFSGLPEHSIVLCPINYVKAISNLHLDLVVNTGSMQEMTEEWIDFWMEWLKNQDVHYFYSLNYFAQPLAYMAEGSNSWSPRLTQDWVILHQDIETPFIKLQSSRFFAEIIAEKPLVKPKYEKEILAQKYCKCISSGGMDRKKLLAAMDIVRLCYDEKLVWDLLLRCANSMKPIPKEAFYLMTWLLEHSSPEFLIANTLKLEGLKGKLTGIRSNGEENIVY
ncbi:MAG: putative sugar O-methyltransferase [Candidatus Saganbacteria bacterium]|nr:putative sugar O-methyltransferase [Candidatus Saganbacteria bacterium]